MCFQVVSPGQWLAALWLHATCCRRELPNCTVVLFEPLGWTCPGFMGGGGDFSPFPFKSAQEGGLKHKQQQSDNCCRCICSKTVYSSCHGNRHCFLVGGGGGGGGGGRHQMVPPPFQKILCETLHWHCHM